ncbi:MAG: hypothetical protein U9Q66_00470 [Patescibacteria group bacterium]|nr:hypothetical protein [Patescibacteria group bacterium]
MKNKIDELIQEFAKGFEYNRDNDVYGDDAIFNNKNDLKSFIIRLEKIKKESESIKNDSQKKTIWIGISENDLDEFRRELVYGNEVIKWSYNTEETNELVDVHFMSEDEQKQREV